MTHKVNKEYNFFLPMPTIRTGGSRYFSYLFSGAALTLLHGGSLCTITGLD